ncbi:hypothetical protein GGE16_003656 [Rhizobium leguminosarum]|uniref:Uncharacterized protein n=1 Tax=Rhizobium leguminosarum TaxID=384 RepID=A0AAE2MLA7_RHILE|nr:hypothetical protein [Rhizobium leguminosarum]MBB4433908.1 hypothetical protein [Rhizobium esperanzae]MBB4298186.1 hypothetical protein [Rhizobium leguminosarum]MBB4309324.1 hypothetical protein [Rhizobium leguminosarum]MBB4418761.1 hypothetical protein [Rhizobium leguminosarum]
MLDRKASLHLGLGADQIGQAFDLDEIKLAIFKSPARELALDRHPHTWNRAKRVKQRRQHGSAAMDLQLGDILAGKGIRGRKKQYEAIVDRLVVTSPNRSVRSMPVNRHRSDQPGQQFPGRRATDANDRNARGRGTTRERKYRISQHGHITGPSVGIRIDPSQMEKAGDIVTMSPALIIACRPGSGQQFRTTCVKQGAKAHRIDRVNARRLS